MDFKPSENYESLKKQAYALNNLLASKEHEISFLRKIDRDTNAKKVAELKAEIQSEKDMNSILTNENELLANCLNEMKKIILQMETASKEDGLGAQKDYTAAREILFTWARNNV